MKEQVYKAIWRLGIRLRKLSKACGDVGAIGASSITIGATPYPPANRGSCNHPAIRNEVGSAGRFTPRLEPSPPGYTNPM